MSFICDNCGKKTRVGRTGKHSRGIAGKRWKKRAQKTARLFKPNLQRVTVLLSGEKKKMRVCTDCLKKFKKEKKIQSFANLALG